MSQPENSSYQPAPLSLRYSVETSVRAYLHELHDQPITGLHKHVMEEVEQTLMRVVLEHTSGNQSEASRILGLTRATVRRKIREHSILVAL
jgi:Fis family transcriptional regulator